MAKRDLGTILREARLKMGLSQAEVAEKFNLNSAQSVSDWERNYGSGIPVQSLKQLIKLYKLDQTEVFEALLEYQTMRLEDAITKEFYGKKIAKKIESDEFI